ncbi:hypothetical protein [Neolewinella sp.]
MKTLTIDGAPVRMDQESGFICVTDMGKLKAVITGLPKATIMWEEKDAH